MSADVPWQNFVFIGMTIVSLPLYLVILGVIIHRRIKKTRFTTTFYALLISLDIADLFSQVSACFSNVVRTSNIVNQFYWENRRWIAPLSYNCVMFCMNLRLFGATLIAIQRYLVVCLDTRHWAEKFTQIPFRADFLLHWLLPLLYTLPILTNFDKDLMGPDDMRTRIDEIDRNNDALMQNLWVLVTFSISAFCYACLIHKVMRHQVVVGPIIGPSKEIRLSVVALGQAVAFTVAFSFYTMSYILAITESPYVPYVPPYMTILTAAISYWNAWIYYFLNRDIRKEVNRVFLGKKTPKLLKGSSFRHSQQQGSNSIRMSNNK